MSKSVDLKLKIRPLLEGEELINRLLVLPERVIRSDSKSERLIKLLDIYKIFVPNKKIINIYNNLYLSLLASLERKNTLEETKLFNNIYKNSSQIKRYGVAGGLDSFKVLGRSGVGKSTAIYRCTELISPTNIIKVDNSDREIIPFLIIECPSDGSFKGLLYSIMHKIDSILGTTYFKRENPRVLTTDFLMSAVSSILINHVGVLIIDEIERVANDSRSGETLINYLTQLVNQTNVSIVFVGDRSSDSYFINKEYMSRRTFGLELTNLEYDEDFYNLCSYLFEYQYTYRKVELDSKLLRHLYSLTNGLPSMTVILFIETQKKAILEDKYSISIQLLDEVYNEIFSNIKPYISKENHIIKAPVKEEKVHIKENKKVINTNLFSTLKKESNNINGFINLLMEYIEVELVKI